MDEGSNKDRLLAEQVRAFEGDKPGPPTRREPVQLMLDLDGFEGPIDVLLTLARDQKVDIARLSVTQLADQYLAFIAQARAMRLELAADYLVMAAWLAYLKSRLLLPEAPDDGEPSGPELAEALTFKLRRLEAMREAADALTRRPRLGRDRFARGMPEGIRVEVRAVYLTGLFDLLKAYGNVRARQEGAALTVTASTLMSPEQALERLTRMLAVAPDAVERSGHLSARRYQRWIAASFDPGVDLRCRAGAGTSEQGGTEAGPVVRSVDAAAASGRGRRRRGAWRCGRRR